MTTQIGEGKSGIVYEITHEGKRRAFKVYTGAPSLIEVDILTRIRHPNVIPALAVTEDIEGRLGIIMPLGEMSLHTYLQEPRSIETKITIFYKIMCAVDFLLDQNILPLDLGLNNTVMIGEEPYIIDMGAARRVDCRGDEILVGSNYSDIPYRMLPIENMLGSLKYSEATVMWNLGIFAYDIFVGKDTVYPPEEARRLGLFDVEDNIQQWYEDNLSTRDRAIQTLKTSIPGSEGILIADLIAGLVHPEVKSRYTMKDIFQHPLFSEEKLPTIGTVTTSNLSLYPDASDDILELVEAMSADITAMMEEYADANYGEEPPTIPSSIILGGVYLYQQYLSQIGRDDDIIPTVLGIVYNIYGLTTLTEYNPNMNRLVVACQGILHPITDYEKAVDKLAQLFPMKELESSGCPKPDYTSLAVRIT